MRNILINEDYLATVSNGVHYSWDPNTANLMEKTLQLTVPA